MRSILKVRAGSNVVGRHFNHRRALTLWALAAGMWAFFPCVSMGQKYLKLLFVGDLMQHQRQIDVARTPEGRYDYSPCFRLVYDEIAAADIAIGNLEVTLGGRPYRGFPAFSAPDDYLNAIRDAGFDVLLTGNNHCLDRGRRGLERTIHLLDSLRIPRAGTYVDSLDRSRHYPLFLKKNGFLIAILSYTYDTNGLRPTGTNIVNYIDREQISRDILGAKARRPDAIIACMHWGNEYQSLPSREQRRLADWLLTQGVTHIIGSHPHVIQPMEVRSDGRRQHVVVYSLGNFISNMSRPGTDGGLLFTLTLAKDTLPLSTTFPRYLAPSSLCLSPCRLPMASGIVLSSPCGQDSLVLGDFSRSALMATTDASAVSVGRREDIGAGSAMSVGAEEWSPERLVTSVVVHCGYRLVWTASPSHNSTRNFVVTPVDATLDGLTPNGVALLNYFAAESRKLMSEHYGGIDELPPVVAPH